MQDDNAEFGSTYRLARAFQPTTDQERRIWATLPGASDDQRQTIIDQALWVALQYGQFVEFRAHHHLPSEAATLRSTLEQVEKVGAKFLDRLRQLDQSQRRLGTGGLALYHALNGPPMACDLSIRQVKTILSEVQSIRERLSPKKSGPESAWPLHWLVKRLTYLWEQTTGGKATRYRDSAGAFQFIQAVAAVARLDITEGQIDHHLRDVLANNKRSEH